MSAKPKSNLASDYLSELINYGGIPTPRGEAYRDLISIATEQEHDNPRVLADRWMQGYELKTRLGLARVRGG